MVRTTVAKLLLGLSIMAECCAGLSAFEPLATPVVQGDASENQSSGDASVAEQISSILMNRCGDCHQDSAEGGFDYVADLDRLVDGQKIEPGQPGKSRIWLRITDANSPMPPIDEGDPLTPEEADLLKKYILSLTPRTETRVKPDPSVDGDREAGSNDNGNADNKRSPVSVSENLASIHNYLRDLSAEDRRYQRFFLLRHLHNLPLRSQDAKHGVDSSFLNLVRAAVSKTINSLTWNESIVVPKVIDRQQTVLAIDLRDLKWDADRSVHRPDLWNLLVEESPYTLKHDQYPANPKSQQQAAEIYEWTGIDVPWLRADWFVATATQPHLYHAILFDQVHETLATRPSRQVQHADSTVRFEQPMNQSDLFQWLRVDWAGNLRRGLAARAAFARSGVSSQFRMIQRHPASYGYLWDSFDFKRGNPTGNLNARPLGPDGVFDDRLQKYSFKHDGGEIIFGLPNGMHGYLLVDGAGDRIPFGPPDIVEDRAKTLGNGIIVNGLSCMACHKNGLIEQFQDEIRFGLEGMPHDVRRMARKLFLDRPELDVLIQQDQQRYREAAIEAMQPFLNESTVTAMIQGGDLVEPVGTVAKRFLVWTINERVMAAELGVPAEKLRAAVEFNPTLRELGLAVVANGGTTNREIWQQGKGSSAFQQTAQILKVGTPPGFRALPTMINANTLPTASAAVAEKVTEFLLERSHAEVAIGRFENKAAHGNYGPGIRQELIAAFKTYNDGLAASSSRQVRLSESADVTVDGTVSIVDDPDDVGTRLAERFLVVKVTLDVRHNGETIYPFTFFLNRSRDIVQADGLNFRSTADDSRQLHKQIRRTRKQVASGQATSFVRGSQISSRRSSPYSIEILTKSAIADGDYSARPPQDAAAAFPLIPIAIGETYAVKVYNQSEHEIAVALKVDGIDQFTFSQDRDPNTGRPRFSNWIVGPKKSFVIKGWHLTAEKGNKNIAPFLVTKYGEGASQFAAVDAGSNGVLTVAISRSHDVSSGSAKSNSETGFGPPIRQDQTAVRRKIDPPHDFISVRYNR